MGLPVSGKWSLRNAEESTRVDARGWFRDWVSRAVSEGYIRRVAVLV